MTVFADIVPDSPVETPYLIPSLSGAGGGSSAGGLAIPAESPWVFLPGREGRPIPEPTSALLLATAPAAMAAWRMRWLVADVPLPPAAVEIAAQVEEAKDV